MCVKSTIFIVGAAQEPRAGIARRFAANSHCCQWFHSAEDFLERYAPQVAGCLITEIRLPRMDGLELLAELCRKRWNIPVILYSEYLTVPDAVQAIKLGAFDVLEKPDDQLELYGAVENALRCDAERRAAEVVQRTRFGSLTPREREVMDRLVVGKKTTQIARELSISPSTVEKHRINVLKKVRVDSVVDLTRAVMLQPHFGAVGKHEGLCDRDDLPRC